MEREVSKINTHIGRSKFAIFAVVGFLALITYLLVTISTQLAQTTLTTDSEAVLRRPPIRITNPRVLNPIPSESPLPTPGQLQRVYPVACGSVCGSVNVAGVPDFTNPCQEGSRCVAKFAGAGGVKVCEPINGGQCVAQCLEGCSLENGFQTHQCAPGSTCKSGGFLGYKLCVPDSGQCAEITPSPAPLPVGQCGEVCIDKTYTNNKQLRTCGAGLECKSPQPNNPASYMINDQCLPVGDSVSCPTNITMPGGSIGRPVTTPEPR